MILKLFKSILQHRKGEQIMGDLYQDGVLILSESFLLHSDGKLFFKNDEDERYFLLAKMKSLEIVSVVMKFKSEEYSMSFVVKDSLKEKLDNFFHKIYLQTAIRIIFRTEKRNHPVYSIYDPQKGSFLEKGKARALVVQNVEKKYLRIDNKLEDSHAILQFVEISDNIQYYVDHNRFSFVWSVLRDGLFYTFCLVFGDNLTFLDFLTQFVRGYAGEQEMTKENENYFTRMEIENYNPCFVDEGEDENLPPSGDSEIEEEGNDDWLGEEEVEVGSNPDESKNSHLVVGPNNTTFIARGGASIGIFKNSDNQLKFQTTIKNVQEEDSEIRKIMTHGNGTSLIFLNEGEQKKLNRLDLERGEVVESWDLKREIRDYFDSEKLVDSGTLVGVSSNSIFRIDPRTKEKVTGEEKKYKTENDFSCGMATGSGNVAIASKKGDLRLYDKIDKRAKSFLPGYGSEIKAVDITTNGKYIICTCKSYLLLTTVNSNYKIPMGKEKPVPKRLQLKPEHLAYINEEISFTPAKFSTDSLEEMVVTSTGHYVVSWNLRDVLKGKLYAYTIKKYGDKVVADSFGFGDNNSIIVMLPDDVKKIDTGRLKDMDREIKRKLSYGTDKKVI